MRMVPRPNRASAAAIIFVLSLCALAETPRREKLAKIRIENFGCINENYFRGAQPQAKDYADLAALGVKAVVDLQQEGETAEPKLVEAAGMKFYRIKMNTQDKPSREQVEAFLKIVDDPANQPVYVHCHGGRHRTGVMTAIYRLTHDGWGAERAFAEMKHYQFDKGFGHGALKAFVYEYDAGMDPQKATGKGRGIAVASPNP